MDSGISLAIKPFPPIAFDMSCVGVYIDENLNWGQHVDFVSEKLKRANGALSKLRHYVPRPTLISLYYALFHSHMSYTCQVWAQKSSLKTQRVLVLQKGQFA